MILVILLRCVHLPNDIKSRIDEILEELDFLNSIAESNPRIRARCIYLCTILTELTKYKHEATF